MIPVLGLVLAFCGFAVCVAVSVFIVWRYINRREKDIVSIIITTVSLSLVLFCVILIPFDVYSLNTGIQPNTTLSSSDVDTESSTVTFLPGVIKYLYYIFFSLLIFCVFGAIPFGYFYFEEGEDEDETVKERILSALKYSVCSILVAIVLIIIGAFVHTGSSGFTNSSDSDFYDTVIAWYDYVKGSGSSYTHGIGFVLSIIGLVGLAIWLVYTACGVFGLPVSLIRGKKHIADELNETQRALEKTRQKIRDLKDKHAGNIRFSLKYEQKLNVLKEKEKTYERHADLLMNKKESRFTRLMSYFKPLAIVLGAVLIIVAVFLLISIVMGLIGKALNSTCGHSCGFAFSIPKFFPIDVILYAVVVVYLFVCTLSGIHRLGIRILWIELFPVHPRATSPQGLLMMTAYLITSFVTLAFEVIIIAPRYSIFGSQKYIDAKGVEKYCSFDAPVDKCHMSQISKFVDSVIGVNQNFIGVVIYYVTYVFVVTSIIFAVISVVKKKSNMIEISTSPFDEDDDIEIGYEKPSKDAESDLGDEQGGAILSK